MWAMNELLTFKTKRETWRSQPPQVPKHCSSSQINILKGRANTLNTPKTNHKLLDNFHIQLDKPHLLKTDDMGSVFFDESPEEVDTILS